MTNFEAAIDFVRKNGNRVEQARLNYLLTHQQPSETAVQHLLEAQRPDGGWAPHWAPDYSSLDATCYHLALAEQMGIRAAENTAITRAATFLSLRQRADGSWEEEDSAADLAPPWTRPGDPGARLYLTANCGYWLGVLGLMPDDSQKAARYLQAQLSAEGRLPSFVHTHWLAGGLWLRLSWKEPAGQVFDYLLERLQELEPSQLAWMANALYSAGATSIDPLIRQAADLLEERQGPDGRWPGEEGSQADVHTTLEALRALRLSGRSLPAL